MLGRGAKDKEHAMFQKFESSIAVIGIDIGKNSFHVVGHDARGAIVLRQKPLATHGRTIHLGQTEKYSARADVSRSSSNNGRWFSARKGVTRIAELEPSFCCNKVEMSLALQS
jgi:hypothetical protein